MTPAASTAAAIASVINSLLLWLVVAGTTSRVEPWLLTARLAATGDAAVTEAGSSSPSMSRSIPAPSKWFGS